MSVQSSMPHRSMAHRSDPRPGGPAGEGSEGMVVEPLAAWHLPLLTDPAFLPLQPQLQRILLLQLPERLLGLMGSARRRRPTQVLVARRDTALLGLLISRPLNRTGSCWQVQNLRIAASGQRRPLSHQLLRQAIQRARGATSWIATSSSLDAERLAVLREQGFQPLLTERLWRLESPPQGAVLPGCQEAGAAEPALRPLNRRTAWALFQLEQAACPAQLRQLLDRSSDDLLDQSQGRGWMLLDPTRNQAVAGLRWLGEHPGGGHDLELTVHPGWSQLIGAGSERLLRQAQQVLGDGEPIWLRSDIHDPDRECWLQRRGAEACGERVLMARSVWRRQEGPAPAQQAARRLEAMLEQLQPRRRPLPTPVGPR